jgi:hypothetical protein
VWKALFKAIVERDEGQTAAAGYTKNRRVRPYIVSMSVRHRCGGVLTARPYPTKLIEMLPELVLYSPKQHDTHEVMIW